MKHTRIFLACFLGVICAGVLDAAAQTTAYQQTNLISSVPGLAIQTDPNLRNPWGIAVGLGQTFFLADNHHGIVKTYDAFGDSVFPGVFGLHPHVGSTSRPTPSGIVANPTSEFILDGAASQFLIATEDGTISGWASVNDDPPAFATQAVDNFLQGAVYTGLAVLTPDCCAPFLAVTNFHSGFIEPYTSFFAPLAPPGSFTDPTLPAGYAPFGIQVLGKQVFVTYALQDAPQHDPVVGAGNGIVSIFDLEGNFLKRFASHGTLNAPWGVVKASPHFGQFSNAILIGNFGDGTINAFSPGTGKFLGQLKDPTGNVIAISGLRGVVFGQGISGSPNTLFFAAGLNKGVNGLFGSISVASSEAVMPVE